MSLRILAAAGVAALAAPAPGASPPGPLAVANRILVERRVAAADGTTRIVAAPRARAAPGDRLIVELTYRNTGQRPIADLVLADPVPPALAYRASVAGSPSPEVSVDSHRFGSLAELVVTLPDGGHRPASADDIVAVRWRLASALAPGAGGTLSFRAVLR